MGGNRDDLMFKGIGWYVFILFPIFIFNNDFIVNIFRRKVHQCKGKRSFIWQDVFARDGINMFFYIGMKFPPIRFSFLIGMSVQNSFKIFKGKFGVNGDQPGSKFDDRVHNFPVFKTVLKGIMFLGKDLIQQIP